MQVMARSSHATCHSFFTVRRVIRLCARRSTAVVFTRTSSTQSRLSGTPRLGCSSPFWIGVVCASAIRLEEHTAELQSAYDIVCRILRNQKLAFHRNGAA